MNRLANRKITPTPANRARYATRPMEEPTAVSISDFLFQARRDRQGLAAGEPGIEVVPVHHFRLAELPTQVHHTTIHHRGKVDQSIDRTFRLHAKFTQLVDIFLQL